MDIDRFVAENRAGWERLDQLTARHRRLSGHEVNELTILYQKTAGDLAYAQAHFSDRRLKEALTYRVAGTAAVLYGAKRSTWRTVYRFLYETFPLAVVRARWLVLASALALFLPAVATGAWVAHSHTVLSAIGSPAVRQAYVDHDFRSYYSSQPSADFGTEVYLNNVEVAMEAFAGGFCFGLLTLFFLAYNGANLGLAAGLFYAAHKPAEFWGLVTPHGLLEMSSVVVAGAAGLKIGWALVKPGDRARSQAVYEEGREAVVLALGTVLTLAVAGSIEGFVTGSPLPTVARVGIGVGVEAAFLGWVVLCGRAAARRAYRRPVALACR